MSRATFMRHFQDKLGRSATEMLTDIRMSLAANELKKPAMSTEAGADSVGYRSVAALRRVFADKMGMTPGQWRRQAREREEWASRVVCSLDEALPRRRSDPSFIHATRAATDRCEHPSSDCDDTRRVAPCREWGIGRLDALILPAFL